MSFAPIERAPAPIDLQHYLKFEVPGFCERSQKIAEEIIKNHTTSSTDPYKIGRAIFYPSFTNYHRTNNTLFNYNPVTLSAFNTTHNTTIINNHPSAKGQSKEDLEERRRKEKAENMTKAVRIVVGFAGLLLFGYGAYLTGSGHANVKACDEEYKEIKPFYNITKDLVNVNSAHQPYVKAMRRLANARINLFNRIENDARWTRMNGITLIAASVIGIAGAVLSSPTLVLGSTAAVAAIGFMALIRWGASSRQTELNQANELSKAANELLVMSKPNLVPMGPPMEPPAPTYGSPIYSAAPPVSSAPFGADAPAAPVSSVPFGADAPAAPVSSAPFGPAPYAAPVTPGEHGSVLPDHAKYYY